GGTAAGVALAARHGRLLPWWVAFWLAIPEHLESECGWWFKPAGWFWLADQLSAAMQDAPAKCMALGDSILEALISGPGMAHKLVD
ncbi:unnamed protein product, partial [Polarella glacialis]